MLKLNRSIDRSITVLEVIQAAGACSLAVLAQETGLPKPTILRICATLENRRWLIRQKSDGCYRLGSAFPISGGKTEETDRLVAASKQEIVRLSTLCGMGVDLAAAIGDGRTEIVDSTRVFKQHGVYPEVIGYRPSPVFSALGLSFLSVSPAEEQTELLMKLAEKLPREERSVLPQLPQLLRTILKQGYAVRADGHWGRAVDYGALPSAIGVPIVADKTPVGAINLVWNADDARVETIVKSHLTNLRAAADVIGKNYARMGH